MQIKALLAILRRASRGPQVNENEVEEALRELLDALGLECCEPESRLWHELAANEPSPKAQRDALLALARAEDPFELARSDPQFVSPLDMEPALRLFARRWRRSPRSLFSGDWTALSEIEQAETRALLHEAAARCEVRRGRDRKTKLDAALLCLADLFLSWTGQPSARHDVPYSVDSQFIQFAAAALKSAGAYHEVSPAALSARWERIVLRERKVARELDGPLTDEGFEPQL